MALVAGVEPAVRLHIARGSGVNDRDYEGLTPLMIAASVNNASLCQILLDAGADTTLTDNYGRDALRIARLFDSDDAWSVIERSCSRNATPVANEAPVPVIASEKPDKHVETQNRAVDSWIAQLEAQTRGGSAWARKRGYLALPPVTENALRDHLANGEDIDVRDGDGRTALMIVAALNKPKMCRLLVEAGANPKLLNKSGKDVLDIARAHQAYAAILEIERATRAASTPWTTAQAVPQSENLELSPETPDEPAADFSGWVVENEVAAPAADGAILARAMEIQHAIAGHVPIDTGAEWDAIDCTALGETGTATAPGINVRRRVVERPHLGAVENLAEALNNWGAQTEISSHTSDGAIAHEPGPSDSPLSDANADGEQSRAITWETVRTRNEDAAKRKRQARNQHPSTVPTSDQHMVIPGLMHDEKKATTEASPVLPVRFWPFVAPSASPASPSKAKVLPLGAVLARAHRAGVQVHGILGHGRIIVEIHVADDAKSRALIRQLVEHGFEYQPMVGYCK